MTLDGSGSKDVDEDPLSFLWSFTARPAGSTAALSDPAMVKPTFKVDRAGDYVAQLIVNDGTVNSAPDTVTISTVNSKPVAHAGPDQTVKTGATVTLDGSGSTDVDQDVLTYAWSLTSRPDGSAATLSNPAAVKPTFIANVAGDYLVQLIVNDGTVDSDPDTVTITAETTVPANQPPTITSPPVTQATVGQLYSYQVAARDPDNDPLTYALVNPPAEMSINPTGNEAGLITWEPTQTGDFSITVTVTDGKSDPVSQTFTITVKEAAMVTVPNVVGLSQTAAEAAITAAGLTVGTVTQETSSTVLAGNVISQNPAADASVARGSAVNLVVSSGPSGGGEPPPDPSTVAPPVDPTVATTTFAATEFLYTGDNPIQTGVAPGTIEPKRTAVLRGKVLNRDNQPLSGVTITVLNHSEFGQTLSRTDGMFDLAVNGGGYLTVNYQRSGYLPAQRQVNAPWQDYVVVEDVVLIAREAQATAVDLTNATGIQVARGGVVTDQDGSRQATLLIPPGTQAQVYNADGSTRAVSSLTLRATEYTVGASGPQAMPAKLPPTTGYTYAVELSADEATTKLNGQEVLLNQPVPFYLENFLNFPVGGEVPVGYYDNTRSAWVAENNGRIIKILSVTGGRAELDVSGTGTPANAAALAALGITDAEREKLATLYAPGKSLWRVNLAHLSTVDINWPYGPPVDAQGPDVNGPEDPDGEKPKEYCSRDCPPCPSVEGSLIECESQTLGESLSLVGTSLSLNYRSDRVPGRKSPNTLLIPLSGDTVPASLKRIDLEISIAGRTLTQSFSPAGGQFTTFTWDGQDGYGRTITGSQAATVRIGYVYDGVYQEPQRGRGFALPSGVALTCPGGCHRDTGQAIVFGIAIAINFGI